MRQQVLRKALTTANFEAFTFDVNSQSFFVKNFTENDIYVSFASDIALANCFLIKSGMGEEIFFNSSKSSYVYKTNTVYIKGTANSGSVEVQALDF